MYSIIHISTKTALDIKHLVKCILCYCKFSIINFRTDFSKLFLRLLISRRNYCFKCFTHFPYVFSFEWSFITTTKALLNCVLAKSATDMFSSLDQLAILQTKKSACDQGWSNCVDVLCDRNSPVMRNNITSKVPDVMLANAMSLVPKIY